MVNTMHENRPYTGLFNDDLVLQQNHQIIVFINSRTLSNIIFYIQVTKDGLMLVQMWQNYINNRPKLA